MSFIEIDMIEIEAIGWKENIDTKILLKCSNNIYKLINMFGII